MPFLYPNDPLPSNSYAPIVLDPSLSFPVDSGYSFRRALHSRNRRIIQLDYLNLTTAQMRVFRDFIQYHRLSVMAFSFQNVVATDIATASNTTPIILTMYHAYMTGQWVGITNSFNAALNGFWQVTRIDPTTFSLNNSTALGTGPCRVHTYFPYAIGHFPEDTWSSPTKLRGPESTDNDWARYQMSVQIEEIF